MVTAGDTIRTSTSGAAGGVSDAVASSAPGQAIGFNQTAFIFGVIAVAFLIYVTIKGDLPKWLGLLGLAPSSASASSGLASPNSQGGGSTSNASVATAIPGTNSIGAALPDVLSGNYGNGGNVIPFPALPSFSSSSAGIDQGTF
jgi:hypothetical protein